MHGGQNQQQAAMRVGGDKRPFDDGIGFAASGLRSHPVCTTQLHHNYIGMQLHYMQLWLLATILPVSECVHVIFTAVQFASVAGYNSSIAVNTQLTLAAMEKSMSTAITANNTNIIIFPEGMLWTFALAGASTADKRTNIRQVAATCNPMQPTDCSSPTTTRLSTLARQHASYLVVNFISSIACNPSSPPNLLCPDDGVWLYNTEGVFHPNGTLMAVYHKGHIFGTAPVLDQPSNVTAAIVLLDNGLKLGLVRLDITTQHVV
jgi:predicted amidohydrolase